MGSVGIQFDFVEWQHVLVGWHFSRPFVLFPENQIPTGIGRTIILGHPSIHVSETHVCESNHIFYFFSHLKLIFSSFSFISENHISQTCGVEYMVSASHLKISEPISQLKVPVAETLKIDSSVVITSDGDGVNVLEEIKSDHFPYVETLRFPMIVFPKLSSLLISYLIIIYAMRILFCNS